MRRIADGLVHIVFMKQPPRHAGGSYSCDLYNIGQCIVSDDK